MTSLPVPPRPQQPPSKTELPRLAVSAVEVGKMLGISRAHVWRLLASGRLPEPVRFGRSVRWDRWTIEEWMAAGAPRRDKWEAMQAR